MGGDRAKLTPSVVKPFKASETSFKFTLENSLIRYTKLEPMNQVSEMKFYAVQAPNWLQELRDEVQATTNILTNYRSQNTMQWIT